MCDLDNDAIGDRLGRRQFTPQNVTFPKNLVPGRWISKDGTTREIKHMDTQHIVNTMALLWRTDTIKQIEDPKHDVTPVQNKIHELAAELKRRLRHA